MTNIYLLPHISIYSAFCERFGGASKLWRSPAKMGRKSSGAVGVWLYRGLHPSNGCGQKQLVRRDPRGVPALHSEMKFVKLCHNLSPECFAPTGVPTAGMAQKRSTGFDHTRWARWAPPTSMGVVMMMYNWCRRFGTERRVYGLRINRGQKTIRGY